METGHGLSQPNPTDSTILRSQCLPRTVQSLTVRITAQTSHLFLFVFLSTCLSASNSYLSKLILPPSHHLFFSSFQPLQVHIVFHEAHPSIPGPALFVVVAYNVLVVGIRMLCQVPLNQVSRLICCKPGDAQKRIWSYRTNFSEHQSAQTDKDLLKDSCLLQHV